MVNILSFRLEREMRNNLRWWWEMQFGNEQLTGEGCLKWNWGNEGESFLLFYNDVISRNKSERISPKKCILNVSREREQERDSEQVLLIHD